MKLNKRIMTLLVIILILVISAGTLGVRTYRQHNNPVTNGNCPSGYSHEVDRYPIRIEDLNHCYKIQQYTCEKTGGCPKCLAASTLIKTALGQKNVTELVPGEKVWSIDKTGQEVLVPIIKVARIKVPQDFTIMTLGLADGRKVTVSSGHPTSDGQKIGDMLVGDRLDGSAIIEITKATYTDKFTYDLLPSSTTGYYWADGILLGSTLN